MQKPTPVITSGRESERVRRATNVGALVDPRVGAVERERLDDRAGQRADRTVVRQRRHRRDVGQRGRVGEPVEPAVGDDGVGVEDHDVAGGPPKSRGSPCVTKPRFSSLCSTVTGTAADVRAKSVDVLGAPPARATRRR